MSKTAAVTASHCRLHIGGFCAVLATFLLLPAAVFAADSELTLRRSDQVDVRRLGKVSEDERSVLRIEWRAGLAGVEETRNVQDMLDKLGRLETGIGDVSHLVRNMPAQPPVVAVADPVAAVVPVAVEAPDAESYNVRLMLANAAAFALVALWWFRRRNPAALPKTDPESMPRQVPPAGANLRKATQHVATQQVTVPAPAPATPPPPEPVTMPEPIAEAPAPPGGEAPGEAATPPLAEPVAPAEPAATPAPAPPEPAPAESFDADKTMILDFSLEEADPKAVARENARLAAVRPASPPEPPPAAQKTEDVEPTLQLAEIMLSMGLEQGAAQALIEYTEANPRHAIYHWLKLLGIYRSRGMQKEFAVTAEKLRLYFNIQAAEWGTPAASEAPTLENFSRVADHVQKIWKQPEECMTYLRRLLEDNRDGARAGFPQSVAEEILLLVEILKAEQA